MDVQRLKFSGILLISPRVFKDNRGFFIETYQESRYRQAGIDCGFVQDNHSRSAQATLRGLHYQSTPGQAKLIRVAAGRIFDVVVDIRPESPTFGQWEGVYLDAEQHQQLFVPVGFAHGFCVMSETADVIYKVSAPYDGATECGIAYDDPTIGVVWPLEEPILSTRDQSAESFLDYARRHGRALD
jgi:dTDP-4-dehydrorhamnose 3,5-epimerase